MRHHTVETAPSARQRPGKSRAVAASVLGLALGVGTLDAHAAGSAGERGAARRSKPAPDARGQGRRLAPAPRRQSPQARVLPGVAITIGDGAGAKSGMLRVVVGSSKQRARGSKNIDAMQHKISMEIGELGRAATGFGSTYTRHEFGAGDVTRLISAMAELSAALGNQDKTSASNTAVAASSSAVAERSSILGRLVAEWIRGQLGEALASRKAQQRGPKSFYWGSGARVAAGRMLDQLFRSLGSQDPSSEILVAPAVVRAVREVVDALKFNPLVRASRGLDPSDQPTDFGDFVAKHQADSPWREVVEAAKKHPATPALESPSPW